MGKVNFFFLILQCDNTNFKQVSIFSYHTIVLDEVDSTNNFLHGYQSADEKAITLVTAEHQSSGRGQRGNSWESEQGKNLIFSLLVYPKMPVSHVFSLSEACALAIRDALMAFTTDIEVKWPNDIYWHDKKIAGILIETSLTGKQIMEGIIGVGVNINQQVFLSDAPNPISLSLITGKTYDRALVMDKIKEQFAQNLEILLQGDFDTLHQRYMSALYHREGYHPYRDEQGPFLATIVGVAPSGHLILKDQEGHERRYAFKEVEQVIKSE